MSLCGFQSLSNMMTVSAEVRKDELTRLVAVVPVDGSLSFLYGCAAVEPLPAPLADVAVLLKQIQHTSHLAEDEHSVSSASEHEEHAVEQLHLA